MPKDTPVLFLKKIGKKGGNATLKKYGPDHFRRIGSIKKKIKN